MILKDLQNIEDTDKRLSFLLENKDEILKAKRREIKWADPVVFHAKPITTTKAKNTECTFEIVGNSTGFMDSHMDVSIRGSYDKTVKESAKYAPFLENHNHSPRGIIGKNMGVEVRDIAIKQLGYDRDGMAQGIIFKVDPCYDEKMKMLYENGEIKQHSIGLQYVKIELCVNDDKEDEAFTNWKRYIDQVINREEADEAGFFFAVLEQKIFEVSAVLFGSNKYTPPLNKISLEDEPPSTQDIEPNVIIQSFINSINQN